MIQYIYNIKQKCAGSSKPKDREWAPKYPSLGLDPNPGDQETIWMLYPVEEARERLEERKWEMEMRKWEMKVRKWEMEGCDKIEELEERTACKEWKWEMENGCDNIEELKERMKCKENGCDKMEELEERMKCKEWIEADYSDL